jgi:acyl-homoserine lactone acylase PvdQ
MGRRDEAVRDRRTGSQGAHHECDGGAEANLETSVHGPVVAEKPESARASWQGSTSGHGQQYWDMMRATNLKEFETALARLQIPMFTVMYADADGHILHLFGGRTPVRTRGDWSMWQRPVPGSEPDTLWTRTHAYEELPKVVDPPSGWLQNANDPPWTTTFPAALNPAKFRPIWRPQGMSSGPSVPRGCSTRIRASASRVHRLQALDADGTGRQNPEPLIGAPGPTGIGRPAGGRSGAVGSLR